MFLTTMMEKYSKVSGCLLLGGGKVFKFPSAFFTCHFLQREEITGGMNFTFKHFLFYQLDCITAFCCNNEQQSQWHARVLSQPAFYGLQQIQPAHTAFLRDCPCSHRICQNLSVHLHFVQNHILSKSFSGSALKGPHAHTARCSWPLTP